MPTDIFGVLEKDHRDVESLMRAMAEGEADARHTFEKLKSELIAHSKAEEKEFYSVLRDNEETSAEVDEALEEHAEIEDLLGQLSSMDADDEQWSARFTELRRDVEHHVREEELEIFPKARHIFGEEAEAIGTRFRHAKEEALRNGPAATSASSARADETGNRDRSTHDEIDSLTRDELYDRAKELGIDGRSKMTKSELARAVKSRL